ncbi:MAG: hypothetical protein M5U08_04325 [Burkholderiales bacterium]|nr:hypothetical protein [Burkholderiales bacterium]
MLERHADQAAGLRRLFARRPQYAVVLAGETHDKAMLAIGLARSLAARGERAVLIDQSAGSCPKHWV